MQSAKDASDKFSHLFKIKKSRIKTALFYALVNLGRDPCLVNNIIWDNGQSTSYNVYSRNIPPGISASYCDIGGGFAGIGNINCNPGFKNADACDYHLLPDSNCIDAGAAGGDYDGETDIDGNPRVIYGIPDIGADEWTNRADLNIDARVDWDDFNILANNWRKTNVPGLSLDSDSDIDRVDLLIFSENWLWPFDGNDIAEESMLLQEDQQESMMAGEGQTPVIYLRADVNEPNSGDEVTVQVYCDVPIFCMGIGIEVAGDAELTGAMSTADCNEYGWDPDWDSDIDISDLKIFSDSWLWKADEYYSKADFNGDNIVNFYDYSLLAGNWQSGVDRPELALFCKDWLWELKWN